MTDILIFDNVRRCSRHGTVISSPDGMFDGLCGPCEAEADGMVLSSQCQRCGEDLGTYSALPRWCSGCQDEWRERMSDPQKRY